ncbi:hypothetical protein NA56DRAFT_753817 [Hyaloscypha hepaticicola]|uniref:Zn(2)-C6 fungal-type domain-containing protein n=1 Tax=Hyaloscypha hepaticicola TaxID=2082293 RepID=A0A2J6PND9_9HELO|nr:hypothetical protein NA56DRAFT_753817 [Hyaloscypha hepaticicola]
MADNAAMDFNQIDGFDFWGHMALMEDGTFMYDEGLNAPPQPQPHQPQLEESFSYNTTVDSNVLQCQNANQGDQRWSLEVPGENQPLPPPPPGNSENYGTTQYDQSPAWSNTSSTVNGDSNHASNLTNHAIVSSTGSRGNNHTLEDHIGIFSIRSNPEENRRRRRAFDPETRRKVAMLRKVGSCSRCKARRIRCNFPGPCLACRKAAESISLAKHICIRQTLIDLRFGDTSFDFLSQSYTEELLKTEIGAFHGEKRTIACNLLFRGADTITQKPLFLQVQDYSDYSVPDANAPPLESDCLIGYDGSTPVFKPVFKKVFSERYALTPGSLPTVKQLLDWIQLDVHSPYESTVKRFMLSLGEFMERYCAEQPDVPMYEMLNSAVTILKLLRCWRNCKMTTCPYTGNKMHISRTVVSQLLLTIRDGICTAEITLLETLEKLIYSSKGPGVQNIIPLWTILWTLILTYRDCMTTYKFSQHCNTSFEHDAADSEVLIEASKHMYHILTSVYAALFKASTPLYLDWREGSNMELLGNSEVLKGAFIALRTEVEWFYGQKHRLGNEDTRLKQEIIEQEQRLKPKYKSPTHVVVGQAKRLRTEDNIVSGCSTGLQCHFDC